MLKYFTKLLFLNFLITLLLLTASNNKAYSIALVKYPSNPLISPSQNWDSNRAWQPSVVFNGTNYLAAYSGYSSGRFQIGIATSTDGINWTKSLNNPILSRLSLDNKDTHDPTIIYLNPTYEMWYVASDNGGATNYSIYRATSSDGNSWLKTPSSPVFRPTTGWGSGGVTSPSVLKEASGYKMWFSSADNGFWEIGYATSPDGTIWTAYENNPILTSNQPWESLDVDGASVVFDNGLYKMIYHTNSILAYAESIDGISWTKNPTNNPVLLKSQTFDINGLHSPSILKDTNNTILVYYTGIGTINNINTFRIGLATDGPWPPSTPTPTNTPTPTPPPTTVNKVIVVPGTFASWNADAIINCKMSGYQGEWQLFPPAKNIYQPLLDALSQAGQTPLLFAFDWRRPIPANGQALKDFINSHTQNADRVNLVGHSMGGLIGRAYLENTMSQNRLQKLLTVGSPHQGSNLAYPAWSGGEVAGNQPVKILTKLLLTFCRQRNPLLTNRQIITTYFPATGNILPLYDFLRDKQSQVLKPILQMFAQNTWLPTNNFVPPFFGVYLGTLTGINQKTIKEYITRPPNRRDQLSGNWLDGEPIKNITDDGDGTVLSASSELPSANEKLRLSKSHLQLVQSKGGIQSILNFLGLPQILNYSETQTLTTPEVKSDQESRITALTVIAFPGDITLAGPSEQIDESVDGYVQIDNPAGGSYIATIKPKTNLTRVIVIQWLDSEKEIWKEYKFSGNKPKRLRITLDTRHPERESYPRFEN